jgi:transcription termination factor Rho
VSVLQRKELEDSPLADIHAIASELGIEGYRGLRRGDLVAAILKVQGGDDDAPGEEPDTEADEKPRRRSRRKPKAKEPEADETEAAEPEAERPKADPRAKRQPRAKKPEAARDDSDAGDDDGIDDADRERATGILDVQGNSSGFLRRDDAADVYVSPAQIRRCELRAGDEVSGPVRPPRRNERYPSLIRVEQINGKDSEPLEERAHFDDMTPVHPTERLASPGSLDGLPFGKGSRVAVAGPPGAGATRLLREIVAALTKGSGDLSVAVVLAGARPEEVTEWTRDAGVAVSGGSFDQPGEDLAQAAQLAVERAKRVAERGGDAVVVIDSLEAIDADVARSLFGAGRKLEQGGSLTVFAAVGERTTQLRVASTRIVLEGGSPEPQVAADRSGTQRADLLG